MRVKIFTEGGSDVGLGHITRCCSLYDEIASRGIDVDFYINGDINNIKFLESYNLVNHEWLSEDYLESQVSHQDYCIVDSYLADKRLYNVIADSSRIALYIDDNNRIDYPKGIVVNPSLNTESIHYNEKEDIEYLLGSKFIILRWPFKDVKKETINVTPHRILVIMGGSDMKNVTPTIIKEISNTNLDIYFDVIVGATSKNAHIIEEVSKGNVKLHYNLGAEDIKRLMTQADFAITAAGQTIYELLATGTPFIPVKIADNQKNNLSGLKKYNPCIRYVDIQEDDWINTLIEEISQIINYNYRLAFNHFYDDLVDGLGTKRIIDQLLSYSK